MIQIHSRNYTVEDVRNWLEESDDQFSHRIVAQTDYRPYGQTGKKESIYAWSSRVRNAVSKEVRHALNVFGKNLYPGRSNIIKRVPHVYRPITVVTLEGARLTSDKSKTVHANITLGNLPIHFTNSDLKEMFFHAWCDVCGQGEFFLDAYNKNIGGWEKYILKEGEKDPRLVREPDGIFDTNNLWLRNTK